MLQVVCDGGAENGEVRPLAAQQSALRSCELMSSAEKVGMKFYLQIRCFHFDTSFDTS